MGVQVTSINNIEDGVVVEPGKGRTAISAGRRAGNEGNKPGDSMATSSDDVILVYRTIKECR